MAPKKKPSSVPTKASSALNPQPEKVHKPGPVTPKEPPKRRSARLALMNSTPMESELVPRVMNPETQMKDVVQAISTSAPIPKYKPVLLENGLLDVDRAPNHLLEMLVQFQHS